MTPETGTRIQLCGRLVVRLHGARIEAELPGRRGRMLFAYLVDRRRRPVGRDTLIDALWPDQVPPGADSALAALLSKLRALLGPDAVEGRSELRLVLPGDAWVDVEAAFEGAHRAESAVALADWARVWGPARVALHTADRGFLPGHDGPWIDDVRDQLDDLRLRMLECIAASGLGLGGPELASVERSGRKLVDLAPYRESGYRYLMHVFARRGNGAEALLVYERLRTKLHDDLGASPSPQTRELHRKVLAGAI